MRYGINLDLSAEEYRAERALNASGAWHLIDKCPKIFWHHSPWNPQRPQQNSRKFDIGRAAHLIVLEPKVALERIQIIAAPTYQSKAARQIRDEAYEAGLTPLLSEQWEMVKAIGAALREDEYARDMLEGAQTEVSFFWDQDGVECKGRADLVTRDRRVIGDIKVSESANPPIWSRHAFNLGYFLRAPWYMDGWNAACGDFNRTTGEIQGEQPLVSDYWFLIVEERPPHPVTICRLTKRALGWGRMAADTAVDRFKRCMREGRWPSYRSEPVTLDLPTWAEFQLAEREQSGEFARPRADEAEQAFEWFTA